MHTPVSTALRMMNDKVYKLVEVGSSEDELHVLRNQVLHMEGRVEVAEKSVARLKLEEFELKAKLQDMEAQVTQLDAMLHNLLETSRCTLK